MLPTSFSTALPQTTAQRLTAGQVLSVLQRYPVGSIEQRNLWQTDLQSIETNQQNITREQKNRFTEIRTQLRNAGLPLNKRRWISKLFQFFGQGFCKIGWDEQLPLNAQPTTKLVDQTLLNISNPMKMFRSVPDIVLEELLVRYQNQDFQNTPKDPVIESALHDLIKVNPLAFSSELGLKFYLRIFENQPIATNDEKTDKSKQASKINLQIKMLSKLLADGKHDGRIIPIIEALAKKHPDKFRKKHMFDLLLATEKFPVLEKIWSNFAHRKRLISSALYKGFTNTGNQRISSDTLNSIWEGCSNSQQENIKIRYLKKIKTPGTENWRVLATIQFFSGSCYDFITANDLALFLRKQNTDYSEFSTPYLVALMLKFLSYVDLTEKQFDKAIDIQTYLIEDRLRDFRTDLAIFKTTETNVPRYLSPIREKISAQELNSSYTES